MTVGTGGAAVARCPGLTYPFQGELAAPCIDEDEVVDNEAFGVSERYLSANALAKRCPILTLHFVMPRTKLTKRQIYRQCKAQEVAKVGYQYSQGKFTGLGRSRPPSSYARTMQCPVLLARLSIHAQSAISGTDVANFATPRCAMPGNDVAYFAALRYDVQYRRCLLYTSDAADDM
eukprot:3881539-Rhodomonas_salina.1